MDATCATGPLATVQQLSDAAITLGVVLIRHLPERWLHGIVIEYAIDRRVYDAFCAQCVELPVHATVIPSSQWHWACYIHRVPVDGVERASAPVDGVERASAPVDGVERASAPVDGCAIAPAGCIGISIVFNPGRHLRFVITDAQLWDFIVTGKLLGLEDYDDARREVCNELRDRLGLWMKLPRSRRWEWAVAKWVARLGP